MDLCPSVKPLKRLAERWEGGGFYLGGEVLAVVKKAVVHVQRGCHQFLELHPRVSP